MATTFGMLNGLLGGVGQVMAGYSPTGTNMATNVWGAWNQQLVGTAYATTTVTWVAWNQQYYVGPQHAQEQMAWQQQLAQQWFQQQAVAPPYPEPANANVEAQAKAKELLVQHLSPVQREMYEKTGMFIVETAKKNHYRLHATRPPEKLVGEKVTHRYCIHTYGVPREDELFGFKLLLEANEEEFLRTANATAVAA